MSYQGYGTRGAHDRRAQVAQALMASSVNRTPQNVGEGISAVGRALFGMLASRANSRQEREGQAAAQQTDMQPIIDYLSSRGDPRASAFGTPSAATPAPAAPPAPRPAPVSPIETTPIPQQGFNLPAIEAAVEAGPVDPVVASAQAAGLDPDAWRQQIQVESGGDPNAVSPANATGLAQVMPETARDPGFGVPNIFEVARQLGRAVPDTSDATLQALLRDPQVNATFGARYQRAMLDQFGGDPTLAAAAYNAGPGAVTRANGVPNFAETQNYVRNVQPRLADPMAGATMSAQAAAPMGQPAPPAMGQPPAQPQGNSRADLIPLLMQAAGNEWLPEGQRAVVQAMLQSELGGTAEGTSAMREYNLARQQGFQGSFLDYRQAVASAGRSSVTVENNAATPVSPYEEAQAAGLERGVRVVAESAAATFEQGRAAAASLGTIEQLEGALNNIETGTLANWASIAQNTFGIQAQGSSAQLAGAIIERLVPQQRPPGSGTMSDADIRMFRASLPSLVGTSEGNAEIVFGMRALAEYQAQAAQIAGNYLANRMTMPEYLDALTQLDGQLSQQFRARRESRPDLYAVESPEDARRRLRELGVIQ